MEKEPINQIAESIIRHINYEKEDNYTNRAIGRVKVDFDREKDLLIWLTNKEDLGGYQRDEDITGTARGTISGDRTTYRGDGKVVYKNQPLGNLLIMNKGLCNCRSPKGDITLHIYNLSKYNPVVKNDNTVDAEEVIIEFEDGEILQYRSLREILEKLRIVTKEIKEKEDELAKEKDEKQILELREEIAQKNSEREQLKSQLQNFIRTFAYLRNQPIPDSEQEKIKSSNIYSKSLVINGGPGTGKTTILIQRIKFLTTNSILQFPVKFTEIQKELILDENKSWIFFSPSHLLSLFLKNAMTEEGLKASDERVKVWADHKRDLCKYYKLINTDTKRPFLNLSISNLPENVTYYKTDSKTIKSLLQGFETFLFKYYREKFEKIITIEIKPFSWRLFGEKIKRTLIDKKDFSEVKDLLFLFYNLRESYNKECQDNLTGYKAILEKVALKIASNIIIENSRINELEAILLEWFKKETEPTETEDEEEIEEEVFEEQEIEEKVFDFQTNLLRKIKLLVRKHALKLYDQNVRFTKNDNILTEKIPEIKAQDEYNEIGQLAFLKKHFERLLKGIEANVLREIHLVYKQFRKEALKSYLSKSGNEILKGILKDKNRRIHPDEQAFLLYQINKINREFAKNFKNRFNESNHNYVIAFKNNMKPVIGIDEATDFSIIDLICIHSFRHVEIASVNFSGDIMQRMTSHGLKRWKDLKQLIPDIQVKDLKKSYRQSSSLLKIASKIYHHSTGLHPEFTSHLKSIEAEPQPLIYLNTEDGDKINWIAERILEIYKSYGDMIPSIAIFLRSDEQLDSFARKLSGHSSLEDVDIKVKACKEGLVLGDKNTVRVFALKYIKGLEFEAVFFHNIDDIIHVEAGKDLLDKYLYVGLSRAAVYMGITASDNFKGRYEYLNELFNEGDWRV